MRIRENGIRDCCSLSQRERVRVRESAGISDAVEYDFGFPEKSSLDLTELFPFDE